MSWFTDPFDNLWNDVAGALYSHPISDTNIFAMNLLAVMQGGTDIVTPPTSTGRIKATGVNTPLRPTWIAICSIRVSSPRGMNLYAIAHRG
jgi:hypothetical protein